MKIDVVLEPFGANAKVLVDVARHLDERDGPIDGLWVYDHFTAMMSADRSWSRDPFVLLGAYAASTRRLRLGTLVANVYNRHPVQLASAIATVQSIADHPSATATRVVCGLGSGAAPTSRFAVEHHAIGVALDDRDGRRGRLIGTADAMRSIWLHNRLDAATDVIDARPQPSIIFGASGPATVAAATTHADGINIRDGVNLADLVALARERGGEQFEISVLTPFAPEAELGTDIARFGDLDIDRLVLGIRSPFDPDVALRAIERLANSQ